MRQPWPGNWGLTSNGHSDDIYLGQDCGNPSHDECQMWIGKWDSLTWWTLRRLPSSGYVFVLSCIDRFTQLQEPLCLALVSPPLSLQIMNGSLNPTCGEVYWNCLVHRIFTRHHTKRVDGTLPPPAHKASQHPEHWTEILPLVFLGIRTALKEDIACTAAELPHGTTLRLPGNSFLQAH